MDMFCDHYDEWLARGIGYCTALGFFIGLAAALISKVIK